MLTGKELGEALRRAIALKGVKQVEVAEHFGVKPPSVQDWLKRGVIGKDKLPELWAYFSDVVGPEHWGLEAFPTQELKSAPNARLLDMPLRSADEDGVQTHQIEYWDAKGSCGGGSHNDADALKGYLAKEPTWFQRYDVRPKDAIAIIADGDSMADFIVDGDIVIFDRSKTEPQSGFIYLIQHPDGLRIKQLRRDINGTWILESRNPNKAHYPDEIIPPEKGELLVIKGKFVYRQGG